jgi:hypothetical protein
VATAVALGLVATGCRAPKKVLTEQDKQSVKDSVLTEAPSGETIVPLNANLDDKVMLVSYSANKHNVKPGDSVAVTLYWKSLAKVTDDYKIFVHLDASKARKTYDHYAINGLYPTANWKVGEVLKDEFTIQVDQGFPPGPARLWVGMFDAAAWRDRKENKRLSVKDAGNCRTDKESRLLVTSFLVGDVPDKVLKVRKATGPVAVDGKLDEADWKQAVLDMGTFTTHEGKPVPPAEAVEGGLLYDDKNLYVAFKVKDTDLVSPYKDRDSTLWSAGKGSGDVVEFYFDPDGDGKKYLELQVSPAGVVFDAVFDSYRNPAWKKAAEANLAVEQKVTVDGTLGDQKADAGYTVEIAIPWTELPGMTGVPAPTQRFKANLIRLSNSGTWAANWSPAGNDFHDLTLAGTVTFGN